MFLFLCYEVIVMYLFNGIQNEIIDLLREINCNYLKKLFVFNFSNLGMVMKYIVLLVEVIEDYYKDGLFRFLFDNGCYIKKKIFNFLRDLILGMIKS